jgi:isopenicillin N synthase-like dioxygenase
MYPVSGPVKQVDVVTFTYDEIKDPNTDLSAKIKEAFGTEGYGICIVQNVPGYLEKRAQLLPLASKVANLPRERLEKLEFPKNFYSIGWSHGKEKFFGKNDYSKGSFYANPQYENIYGDSYEPKEGDVFAPNVWPTEDVPELQNAFKDLGCLIVETGILLSKHIDDFIKKEVPTYEDGKIQKIIQDSKCCKARLLHYFPSEDEKDAENDWCGWHNDHGTLTGLCSAMYFDKQGNEVDFKDPESGLFVQKRSDEVKKAAIPKDCLAFQIGESAQIHSGGRLQATPHAVLRGKKLAGTGFCRNTFAVFMQPDTVQAMPPPKDIPKEDVYVRETRRVPKLQERWDEKQNFTEFATVTFASYAEEPKEKETTN